MSLKRRPREVRDALLAFLSSRSDGASTSEIENAVQDMNGRAAPSSIRSSLRLNTPRDFREKCTRSLLAPRDQPRERG